jgi:hypothetical protein
VPCQFTHTGPRTVPTQLFESLGNLSVNLRLAIVADGLVHGVLDEGMGEAVAPPIGQLTYQGRRGGGVEDVEQVVVAGLGGSGQQVEVEVAADDRGHREHTPGLR